MTKSKKSQITNHKSQTVGNLVLGNWNLFRIIRNLRLRTLISLGLLVIILPIILITLYHPSETEAEWYNDNWAYRKKITIDNSKVSGSTNFTDFPILITESSDADLSARAQSDGDDIIFTDHQGRILAHEIEYYSSGTLTAWVKVPTLLATADTVIYMYYGNSSVSAQEKPEETWESSYTLVQHFQETSGTQYDSTYNNSDLTSVAVTSQGSATGKIDGANEYDAVDDYAEGSNISLHSSVTIEGWLRADTSGETAGRFFNHDDAVSFTLVSGGLVSVYFDPDWSTTDGEWSISSGQPTAGTLFYVAITYNYGSTANDPTIYINGSSVSITESSTPAGTATPGAGTLTVGNLSSSSTTRTFDGVIDEMRIHNTERSADYIATSYNTQNHASSAFYSLGSQEVGTGPVAYWKFDEGVDNTCSGGSNDACDSTTNGNDGAKTGATWQTEDLCVSGKCLLFDGTDDVVTVSNTVSNIQSVSFWVKVMSTSTTEQLIDLNATDYLTSTNGTVTAAGFGTETIYVDGVVGSTLTASRWHHVAVTTSSALSGSAIKIGQISTSYGNAFIDEVKIYPYARSATQIKVDYTSGAEILGKKDQKEFLSDGLVGYWKMDESSGNASDSSGNGTTLTNNSSTAFSGAKFGNGAEPDGTTDYFEAADNTALSITGDLTLSAWINPDDVSGSQDIVGKWDGTNNSYMLALSGDELRMYIDAATNYETTSSTNLTATMTHVAGVYDAASQTVKLFVNGSVQASSTTGTIPSSIGDDAGEFVVGADDSAANFFDGHIDEVRVYNRALSPTEVRALYHWAPGPVGYWDFDQNDFGSTSSEGVPYGGMLAYCNGTDDTISYRIMQEDGTWTTEDSASDVSSTRCQRVQVYADPTSSEKILLSLHSDGFTSSVYGQVWDGDSWNTPQILGNPTASNVWSRQMDGAYLADGTFMAFYADSSTSVIQFAVWNGSSWSTVDGSTQDIGSDAITIIARARPGTNEVMIVTFDTGSNTETIYYDGSGTDSNDFTHTSHASSGSSANGYHIDFAWSQNSPTRGALVYTNASSDQTPVINIFTANGSGGGSWGTENESQDLGFDTGALQIVDRPNADEFLFCADGQDASTEDIVCFEENDNDTTPTINTTTNGTISDNTEPDDDTHNFDLAYEQQSGNPAIAVYSDNSTAPKLKTYNPTNNTWDSSVTETLTTQTNTVKNIDVIPDPNSDDIVILTRDTSLDIHTTFWDGDSDQLYSSGDRANTEISDACGQYTDAHCADFAWNLHTESEQTLGTTVYDRSGNGNNGTAGGSMTNDDWVPGKFGSALDFDGTDDTVTISDTDDLSFGDTSTDKPFSVSAWVKMDDATQFRIFSKGSASNREYAFATDSSDQLFLTVYDDVNTVYLQTYSAAITSYENSWVHVAGTYDGSESSSGLDLYINGVLTSSTDTSNGSYAGMHNQSTGAFVGQFFDDTDPTSYANGSIDEVKVYNYIRTPGQIVEDMNAGHPAPGSPIGSQTVYWKFDEQYGTTAYDSVGNENGTVDANLTWNTQTNCKINGCLKWDTAGEEVSIATANDSDVDFNGSEAFSGSAWVYVTTMPGSGEQDAIIAKWDDTSNMANYKLYVENDDADTTGNFEVQIYDESASQAITASQSNDSVAVNTWYHVSFTFNGGTAGAAGDLKLYVDGRYTAQNSANTSFLGLEDKASDFTVGEYDPDDSVATNTAFTGYIDEVKIYNSALTADQIKLDYNAGSSLGISVGRNDASDISDGAGNPPILIWNLDENTSTSANDTSGNGKTGTLINSPTWTAGKYGSGVNFAGSNQHITRADDSDLDFGAGASFSLESWFRHNTASAQEMIAVKFNEAGYKLLMESDGDITCGIDYDSTWTPTDSVTSTAATYDNNAWHHVACVKDANTSLTLYIDGVSVGTPDTSLTNSTLANSDPLYIGINADGTSNDWVGDIDHVVIYNYARTPAQIAYDYNRGAPVVWYKLDECQGGTAYDSSGNSSDGTITIGSSGSNTSLGTCSSGTGTEAWNNGTTGKRNASLDFDGTNDYIAPTTTIPIRDNNPNTEEHTISLWFKTNASSTGPMFMIGDSPSLDSSFFADDAIGWRSGTGNLAFSIHDGVSTSYYVTASGNYRDNSWHHIATLVDDTSMKLYIDGEYIGQNTNINTSSIQSYNSAYGWIATRSKASSTSDIDDVQYYNGQLDDVRIYNYALSQAQIKKVMNEGAVRFGPAEGSP